jgi:TRAP-type mannitol/chloroaromatic compound transport system permease small subunit
MVSTLASLCDRIDRFADGLGRVVAWGALAMAGIQFGLVLVRHLFGLGALWPQESLAYFHAALILFAAAWTLRAGGHVRVDVFYAEASVRTKAWIDLVGALVLLLPFMAALAYLSFPYARRAWVIMEGSREAGGLPLVFLLKGMIPLFAVHFFLQGVAQGLCAGMILAGHAPRHDAGAS